MREAVYQEEDCWAVDRFNMVRCTKSERPVEAVQIAKMSNLVQLHDHVGTLMQG